MTFSCWYESIDTSILYLQLCIFYDWTVFFLLAVFTIYIQLYGHIFKYIFKYIFINTYHFINPFAVSCAYNLYPHLKSSPFFLISRGFPSPSLISKIMKFFWFRAVVSISHFTHAVPPLCLKRVPGRVLVLSF